MIAAEDGTAPRIYIEPQDGLDSYVAAAIVKKHVPVVVTQNKDESRYILVGSAGSKEESTGGKIVRCLFAYCIGANGYSSMTVRLIDNRSQEVMWAYTVGKGWSGAYQSTAEAVAKHLKQFLEEHPR